MKEYSKILDVEKENVKRYNRCRILFLDKGGSYGQKDRS